MFNRCRRNLALVGATTKVVGKFTLRFFSSIVALAGLMIPSSDLISNEYISATVQAICAVALFAYGVKKVFPK